MGVSAALKTWYVAGGACGRADRPVRGECGAGRLRPAVPGHPGHRCAERVVLGGFWGLASRPATCSTCPPWSQVRRGQRPQGFRGCGVPRCTYTGVITLARACADAAVMQATARAHSIRLQVCLRESLALYRSLPGAGALDRGAWRGLLPRSCPRLCAVASLTSPGLPSANHRCIGSATACDAEEARVGPQTRA